MNRRWNRAAAALLAALTFTMSAFGAHVVADGAPLSADQAWIDDGTSYITLRTYASLTGHTLTWDGQAARLSGEDLSLEAEPGALYITVNGHPFYVEGGVQITQGMTVLPLRILTEAVGGSLSWDSEDSTAHWETAANETDAPTYDEEDLYWLSRVISAESRGESLEGQIAVGNVVLNRVADKQFPDTIKDVVFDTKNGVQFEPTSNGTIYDDPVPSAVLAAKLVLDGADVVGDCLYFYAPALSAGTWIKNNRTYHTTIGCHRFFR